MEGIIVAYLIMIPVATVLILWDWARRGVDPDFTGALIMGIWWPVVFFAVITDIFEG